MHRRADNNQRNIVKILRKFGVWVKILSNEGFGFPDLLCYWRGILFLIEVKDGDKATLTPDQKKFHEEFPGKIYILRHEEDIQKILSEVEKDNYYKV